MSGEKKTLKCINVYVHAIYGFEQVNCWVFWVSPTLLKKKILIDFKKLQRKSTQVDFKFLIFRIHNK